MAESPVGNYSQGRNLLVVWRVTTACNLGCGFCDYNANSDIPRVQTSAAAALTFGRVLAEYGTEKGESVRVSWLGGEPFLWSSIHEVSRNLAAAGLSLSATTNGTALGASKVIATLHSHFDALHVSVDGVGDAHDHSRRKEGLYARILRNISHIVKNGDRPRVGVNLLLTAQSILNVDMLCRQLGDAGVTFLSFNPLFAKAGTPEADRKLSIDDLPMLDDIEACRAALAERTGVTVLGSPEYFERVRNYVRGEAVAVPLERCHPGRSRLLIDERGCVRPCSFVEGPQRIPIADVRSVEDLLALREGFEMGIRANRPPACDDCMEPFVFGKFDLVP